MQTDQLDINSASHLTHQVAEALRLRIENGETGQGNRLPTERAIASQFGVSRKTVNCAISNLVRSGHIERAPRRGTFVSERWKVIRNQHTLIHRLWIQPIDEDWFGQVFDSFGQAHQGVQVQALDSTSKQEPDVARLWMPVVGGYRDKLLPLADRLADSPALRNMPDSLLERFGGRDGLYAVPLLYSGQMLYYHKGRFDEAGIPYPDESWDWDALRNAVKRLDDPKGNRFGLYPHHEFGRLVPFIWQNGGELFDRQSGACAVASDRVIEAIDFHQDLIAAPLADPNLTKDLYEATADFAKGRYAMFFWGGRLPAIVARGNPDAPIAVAEPPKGRDRATFLCSESFAVYRESKRPELACALIEQLVGLPALRQVAAKGNYLVANQTLQTHSNAAIPYFKALDYTRTTWGEPDYDIIMLLFHLLSDLKAAPDIKKALQSAEDTVNTVLSARRMPLGFPF